MFCFRKQARRQERLGTNGSARLELKMQSGNAPKTRPGHSLAMSERSGAESGARSGQNAGITAAPRRARNEAQAMLSAPGSNYGSIETIEIHTYSAERTGTEHATKTQRKLVFQTKAAHNTAHMSPEKT
jgi:hypothetical protein